MPRTGAHLEPLEAELERNGVRIGEPMPSPYGPDWGLWSEVDCVFLGGAHAASGNQAQAVQHYRQSVALSPDEANPSKQKLARLEGSPR